MRAKVKYAYPDIYTSKLEDFPKYHIYITRWLRRARHKRFEEMINNSAWYGKITVVVSGKGCSMEAYPAWVDVWDWRGKTNERDLSDIERKILIEHMRMPIPGEWIGFMDDDAVFHTPEPLEDCLALASNAPNCGVCGPISQYIHTTRYKGEGLIWHKKKPYWSTLGCQFYLTEAIQHTRLQWEENLLYSRGAADFCLFTTLMIAGWDVWEFYCSSYYHHCSNMTSAEGHTAKWFLTYHAQILFDIIPMMDDAYVAGHPLLNWKQGLWSGVSIKDSVKKYSNQLQAAGIPQFKNWSEFYEYLQQPEVCRKYKSVPVLSNYFGKPNPIPTLSLEAQKCLK